MVRYGIRLTRKTYSVFENDKLIATKFYGEDLLLISKAIELRMKVEYYKK
jgi:hypothetical protein